jgi:hypothetical protein
MIRGCKWVKVGREDSRGGREMMGGERRKRSEGMRGGC